VQGVSGVSGANTAVTGADVYASERACCRFVETGVCQIDRLTLLKSVNEQLIHAQGRRSRIGPIDITPKLATTFHCEKSADFAAIRAERPAITRKDVKGAERTFSTTRSAPSFARETSGHDRGRSKGRNRIAAPLDPLESLESPDCQDGDRRPCRRGGCGGRVEYQYTQHGECCSVSEHGLLGPYVTKLPVLRGARRHASPLERAVLREIASFYTQRNGKDPYHSPRSMIPRHRRSPAFFKCKVQGNGKSVKLPRTGQTAQLHETSLRG